MKKVRLYSLFLMVFVSVSFGHAQNILSGSVKDDQDEPLIGVNVYLKGLSVGTTTDIDGKFSLSYNGDLSKARLVASFIGYKAAEVSVGDKRQFNLTLIEESEILNEIVIGYTKQDQEKVTGSISLVSAKELNRVPVPTVDQALQGRAPGVTVTQNTGAPGEGVSVRIRGVGSINSSNDPLYVVDGIPTLDALNSIAPQDIESITILKDASAAAIYGSRAANGVVLITTKSGAKGKAKIQLNSQVGVQMPSRKIGMANKDQYVEVYNEAANNDNATKTNPLFHRRLITEEIAATLPDVDHLDAVFRESLLQMHSISISGGEGKTQYLLSGSFFNNEGIVLGSGYERITGRANIHSQLNDWLKAGMNMNVSRATTDLIGSSGDGAGGNGGSILRYAFFRTPGIPIKNGSGEFVDLPERPDLLGDGYNPVGLATYNNNRLISDRYFNKFFVEINPLKNVSFISNLGFDFSSENRRRFDRNWGTNNRINNPNRLEVVNGRHRTITNSNVLSYKTYFNDKHFLNIMGGSEAVSSTGYLTNVAERDFPDQDPNLVYLGNGQGEMVIPRETQWGYSLLSFFGKADYEFNEKYIASATLRRDGSSRFIKENRWGTFYAGSLGWRLEKEAFLKDKDWLDGLLLRAGYGSIGNQEIGNYAYAVIVSPNYNYPFGGVEQPGFAVSGLGNDQLQWETSNQLNIGTDVELWEGKLGFSIDYFNKVTSDMLVLQPMASSAGKASASWVNNGKILNRGLELAINHTHNIGDFNYSINANVTRLHNEVLELNAPIQGGAWGSQFITRTEVGHPVGSFYMLEMEGIFQDQADIFTHAYQGSNIRPGDVKFKDQDGNGIIDENDRKHLGSAIPKFTAGLNIDLNYKNWDFSAFFQGAYGHKIYSVLNMDIEGFYRPFNVTQRFYENRWTGPGSTNEYPRASWDASGNNNRVSNRFLEDGSYTRLKNLQLGYTLPANMVERYGLERVRLYFSGVNLFTFTKYQGLDPEMTVSDNAQGQGDRSAGLDWGTYPAAKSYNFGINITF